MASFLFKWSGLLMGLSLTNFLLLIFVNSGTTLVTWEGTTTKPLLLQLPIIFDSKSLIFGGTVTLISSLIMLFSRFYMDGDLYLRRFIYLVLLFVGSMALLIYIPNLITLLIGWDGLGITSFLLVIYYQNGKSLGAGMITALTNRIGDVLLLLLIGFSMFGGDWSPMCKTIIFSGYLLVFGSMTKSAQVPFSAWLPAAMAAPTPVSALVHSSTLVTAGVYLLIRFSASMMTCSPAMLLSICSAMTMLMSGVVAMLETDMKKIIALSTLSQLGVMMFSVSMSLVSVAFFHLIAHAFFKAILFVCGGNIIHLFQHNQELRLLGGLITSPMLVSVICGASMALCGAPFMAGFYSKDLIIESNIFSSFSLVTTMMFSAATICTVSYSLRFMIYVVASSLASSPSNSSMDLDKGVFIPSIFLGALSIFSGALFSKVLVLEVILPLLTGHKMSTLGLLFMGSVLGLSISLSLPLKKNSFSSVLYRMWGLVSVSAKSPILTGPTPFLVYKQDSGALELIGPTGVQSAILKKNSSSLQKIQSVSIQKSLLVSLLSGLVLVSYISWDSLN